MDNVGIQTLSIAGWLLCVASLPPEFHTPTRNQTIRPRRLRMDIQKYSRSEDRPASSLQGPRLFHCGPLLGTWSNTNSSTWGIAKLTISQEEGTAYVRVFGSGPSDLIDWGKKPIETIYAKDAGSAEAVAFDARYDLGFMHVVMEANVNLGLLVVACLNTFKDNSGRSNYFSREFFWRRDQA
jgi:hypothetical protein